MTAGRATDQPGRLSSVMLRALAAELSDPGRFNRAKSYARDGAVVAVRVESGAAYAEVRGSRFEPYAVTIGVEPTPPTPSAFGLVPDRSEVWAECSCPDDGPDGFCKHALATLLVLADLIGDQPELLGRWRTGESSTARPDVPDDAHGPDDSDDVVDSLARALAAPAPLPDLARLPPRLPVAMGPGDDVAADVLADALAALRSH